MRLGWVGFHSEGVQALRSMATRWHPVEAVITLDAEHSAQRSSAADYSDTARELNVPLYEVANINSPSSVELLKSLKLDIVFVIGWTQLLRAETLQTASIGMIGAHASLLPRLRGRAPINWALINGETETGNTLFWLADGTDTGSIIDQTVIPITAYDTCHSLYERVADSNESMLRRVLPQLVRGERPGRPQPHTSEPVAPGRKPEHGNIDWSRSNVDVYNFIRALTRPYPGAFSTLDGKRWFVWEAALIPGGYGAPAQPGQVLGPIHSPVAGACGQLVACGQGAIALLNMEDENGNTVTGHSLSDRRWTEKVWRNE